MASKKRNGGQRDLTTQILVQIRDEMRHMREDLGHLEKQMREDLGRLEKQMREDLGRLENRQSEDSTRVATELVAVAHAVIQVRDLLRDQRGDRKRIDDHEKRLRTLERKIA